MSKKLAFLITDVPLDEMDGYREKLEGQKKAIDSCGFESFIGFPSKNRGFLIWNSRQELRHLGFHNQLSQIPLIWRVEYWRLVSNVLRVHDVRLIIFRVSFKDIPFLLMVRSLRNRFPKAKFVLDVPTFPYDREFSGNRRPLLLLERVVRSRLKNYFDLVLAISVDKDKIFQIPVISIENGINTAKIPRLETPQSMSPSDALELVFVGHLADWHGIDRFVRFLCSADVDRAIRLTILTPKSPMTLRIIRSLPDCKQRLSIEIVFDPSRRAVEEALEVSHVGVGTFGFNRTGVHRASPLKHREYAAYGLPIVTGIRDDAFGANLWWYCDLSASVPEMVSKQLSVFLQQIVTRAQPGYKTEVQTYCRRFLDWESTMHPFLLWARE